MKKEEALFVLKMALKSGREGILEEILKYPIFKSAEYHNLIVDYLYKNVNNHDALSVESQEFIIARLLPKSMTEIPSLHFHRQ